MTEYIRMYFDMGDLDELNGLGSVGWRIVQVLENPNLNANDCVHLPFIAVLERQIGPKQ